MRLRRWLWRHPEWWALASSVAAWVLLWMETAGHHGHHAGMHQSQMGLGTFALMAVAMMVPATIGSIRAAAARSLWRRRQRAVLGYLLGFLAIWLVVGALIVGALSIWSITGATATAVALVAAAVWQLTPTKRRALYAHHGTRPLAPSGAQADRDCLLYGGAIGSRCVVSCGPMMAAMALGAHMLGAMVAITGVVLMERYRFRPPRRTSAVALGALAVVVAVA